MDAVEDIKARLNIEDVVGEYVELKRAGSNLKGLSPFTHERTPSFMVSPEKQIWHDFSSGKGGDMFSFVMEADGLDFRGAMELLARKAGIDLDQYGKSKTKGDGNRKARLAEALEWAAKFYQAQLKANKSALEYVIRARQFNKTTLQEFRLGYAPNTGGALVSFLRGKKISPDDIKAAGLVSSRYPDRDMFRGRIMVPLADPFGQIIGFTARLLEDDPNSPKYINTPQTPLYDKGRHVYGLHLAKDAIRKTGYVVLVEGNLDVIASHQAGVRNVVATAGTALTPHHLKALSRLTTDVRLCFDADRAGIAATERAIPIAQEVGVNLSIITLPEGKDPDELVRKSPIAWQTAIDSHKYAVDWVIERYREQLDIKSGQGKRQFSDIVLKLVGKLTDRVEREHYIREVGGILGVSGDALLQKLGGLSGKETPARRRSVQKPSAADTVETTERRKTENHLLAVTLMVPGTRGTLEHIEPDMLLQPQARVLLRYLVKHADYTYEPGGASLPGALKEIEDYIKIIVLGFEELYEPLADRVELDYEAGRLHVRLIERYVKQQKQELVKTIAAADEPAARTLLTDVKKLDQLLQTTKEYYYG